MRVIFSERSFRVNTILDLPLDKIPKIYPLYWKVSKIWAKFKLIPYGGNMLRSFYEHLLNYLLEKVEDKDIDNIETPFNIITEIDEINKIVKEFIKEADKIHKSFKKYYEAATGFFDKDIIMSFAIFPFNENLWTHGHSLQSIFISNSILCDPYYLIEMYKTDKRKLFYSTMYTVHEVYHYVIGLWEKESKIKLDNHVEEHVVRFLTKKTLLEEGIISEDEFIEYIRKAVDTKIYKKIKDYNFEETIFEFLKKKRLL